MAKNRENYKNDQSVTRIIEVNGKKFLVGMLWQPLLSAAGSGKEIAAFAKEQDMNIAVEYSGLALQAGYAHVTEEKLKESIGAWCLVPVLATALGESWLGAFDLDNGLSIMAAVHDGKIIPGCDAIGPHDEIHAMVASVISMEEWDKFYTTDEALASSIPPGLEGRVVAKTLKEILVAKRYSKEHKAYSPFQTNTRVFILGAVIVAMLVAAWFGYQWYQKEITQKQAQAAEQALKNSKDRKKKGEREKALEEINSLAIKPTWTDEPAADSFVDLCTQAINNVPLMIGGWKLREATCMRKALTMSYGRVLGMTMLDFKNEAQKMKIAKQIISFTVLPDSSKATIALQESPNREEEDLIKADEFVVKWVSFFQSTAGITSEYKEKPHPKPAPPKPWVKEVLGDKDSEVKPPWWETYTWSVSSTKLPAADILRGLPRFPGFVVKKITLNVTDGASTEWKWSAEGEVNVKP